MTTKTLAQILADSDKQAEAMATVRRAREDKRKEQKPVEVERRKGDRRKGR